MQESFGVFDSNILIKRSLVGREEVLRGWHDRRLTEFEDVIEEFLREKGESIDLMNNFEFSSVNLLI
jgi:hypothetical protein